MELADSAMRPTYPPYSLLCFNARRCVFALSLVLAVSCTSTKRAWFKDEATQADFKRDAYACERDVRVAFPNQPITDNALMHIGGAFQGVDLQGPIRMFQRCMEAQGYELRRVE